MNNENKIIQEMRRGIITLAVLNQLDKAQYGYSLIKQLKEKGLTISQDILYPLLRKLEDQGLLESNWQIDSNRPRRYYKISKEGKKIRETLKREWEKQVEVLRRLLQ